MKLKHFDINRSLDQLKNDRNALARKYHPDLVPEGKKKAANEIMKGINEEYNYVIDPRNRITKNNPVQDQKLHRAHGEYLDKDSIQSAQNIFHALTSGQGVNIELLIKSITSVKDWKQTFDSYYRQYGITTALHVSQRVSNKEIREQILLTMQIASKAQDLFSSLSKYF